MWQPFMLVHILGAVLMGFYALAPFVAGKLKTVSAAGQEGVLTSMITANRIAQFMLIVNFITGGYLMSQGKYSYVWMGIVTLLFLAIAAFSGIMGKKMKLALQSVKNNQSNKAALDKITTFSTLIFVMFIVMVVLMVYNF
ncbi:hypothetical protein MH117_00560 [Paenibacillus sp. ACRRX]|uniref:hypothetical protein n=1 Tax=Paenibacillus sp. ACRRX TaxID=2918206 RepID=UPI001EF3D9E7|nr:hypothetical protein [Paenibacillus sp. ACRRX]MCG7405896.1 hypothetical protein [Paenibacillus sp. ACRRX]